ncbi:hypothetical protein MMC2321_04234 [Chitinophaga sp. MM2321]
MTGTFISQLLPANQLGGDDFKLVKEERGISLYERWIPGAEKEPVRELKAVFFVHANKKDIHLLLTDQERGTDWNMEAKAYNVLPAGDENTWITYIKYSIPWPFDDQDCCLKYHVREEGKDGKPAEITFESTSHSRFPVFNKVTRITGVQGKWLLHEQGNGSVKVIYSISTNRSKKVPRWVSDPIVRGNLFETMNRFKTLVEKAHGVR